MEITTEAYQEIVVFCEEGLKEEALYGIQFEVQLDSNSSKRFDLKWVQRMIELANSFSSQVGPRIAKASLNIVRN